MSKKILWISHRGLLQFEHSRYDENSLGAFQAACKAGFSWLETDLQCSKDNHIVLSHDNQLNRVAACSGQINQLSRLELESIELKQGGRLLFLDRFMSMFCQQHWVFDI